MHINLESDYAVRIVYCLARFGQKMDAQRIAEETGFPALYIENHAQAGNRRVSTSFKGAHGGYTLSRAPEEITLRQAIEAVEGPYRFSRCLDEHYDCNNPNSLCCPFHHIFGDITQMVVQRLDTITFDPKCMEQYAVVQKWSCTEVKGPYRVLEKYLDKF